MTDSADAPNLSRRRAAECLAWGGGFLWMMAGGVPRLASAGGIASASAETTGFTFAQISDSHIGFNNPANPNPAATLTEAIAKVGAAKDKPAFMIHTGDITHLSKPDQFDDAEKIISAARLDVHYVPGEHDLVDDGKKAYLARYGKDTKGSGWYAFDHNGVHFVGLVNADEVVDGGGHLGEAQLAWLANDLKGRASSTPVVLFAHYPLWPVYQDWGWTTDDGMKALDMLKGFGSVTVLNGHIHQVFQKVEGHATFHTARSTAFPQGKPGVAVSAGPMRMPEGKLRTALGIASVTVRPGVSGLLIADSALEG